MIEPPGEGPDEEILAGGTAHHGRVVRIGDTVRRPRRERSPATHALLAYLEDHGFGGSPRLLGIDEQGREILTYIDGIAPIPPYPAWALTDEALASVGELLRRFHQAIQGFRLDGHAWEYPLPSRWAGPTASHNDPNLDNIVFRAGRAVALIDFDLAGPGCPEWDLALAARLWCPLRDDDDVLDTRRNRGVQRLAVLLDAYGAGADVRRGVIDALPDTLGWSYDLIRTEARRGHPAFRHRWVTLAGARRAERSALWMQANRDRLRHAVG